MSATGVRLGIDFGTSHTVAPGPADPPARSRRRLAIISSAAAALIVTATATATGIAANRNDEPTGSNRIAGLAADSSTAGPSPSVTPSANTSASQVDPCLVGRWRSTSIVQDATTTSGDRVQFSGGAWIIVTYRANGTMTVDYNRSKPKVATPDGVKWSNRLRGVINAHVYHDGGHEFISAPKAKGTNVLYRNGERDKSIPLSLILQPEKYRCAGNTAAFYGDNVVSEYLRY